MKLKTAIKTSQEYLIRHQAEEGYWIGELIVDVTVVADKLMYHYWNGSIDDRWRHKAVNHILSKQLPDGGWNIYYGGPAEVNATVKGYLALKLAGVPTSSPEMIKARSEALRLGGVPEMNTFSKLYLALLGLFPWDYLPTIPSEFILVGKWFFINFHEMSNWSRSMLAPLSIINHYKPTRPVGITIDELYPSGYDEAKLALQPDAKWLTWRNFFLKVDRIFKFFERHQILPLRRRALRTAERWMIERFEGADGLAAIFPAMLNSLIALKVLGYSDRDPLVQWADKQLKDLEHETEDSVRIEPCFSPVWDTAIAVVALDEAGLSEEHPAMKRAAEWLMNKEIRFRGDWYHKHPTNVEPSGWVFEFNNPWNPDFDDTAMVLLALRKVPTDHPEKRDACFRRGLNWMLQFQCHRGGWAAFDKDCTKALLDKVPFADHNAMLDPECADITARVLELLGYEGFSLDNRQVRRAIEFLKEEQEADGSWYGRWGVNYLYGTWQVLRGLAAIGMDLNEDWLLRARDWLESVQQNDGGWGERCDTYEDPLRKGKGPSTASQTAWAVMGLSAFGDPERPSLRCGIEYLIRNQNPDGSWTEWETTGSGFPKVFYLKYDMYRNTWPLMALGTYRRLLQEEVSARPSREINGHVRPLEPGTREELFSREAGV